MKINVFRKILVTILLAFVVIGAFMILIPLLEARNQEVQMENTAESWVEQYRNTTETETSDPCGTSAPTEPEPILPELRKAMEDYNREIAENGQSGLVDAWSYQSSVFDLSTYGVSGDTAGVITIPKIDVKLPLYLGASYENMAKGFAQLSQTSMPIGGVGTNCVVTCHRGWHGAAYMRDADQLVEGDIVYLENFWETLCYKVISTKVIEPHETDEILIQQGRDLLTIVTCTPYRVGSHRLLIFCERVCSETTPK